MKRRTFLRSAIAIGALSSTPLAGLERVFASPAPESLGPLLAKWGGPHGGIPPFGVVKAADIKPGLLKGMDLMRAEIKQIVSDKSAPAFENTLVPFEDSGRPLGQAGRFFEIYTGTMNDKAMQAVETEMSPVLAAFRDEVTQNEPLFRRIKAVYDARGNSGLDPEQQRLTDFHYTCFAREGANCDKAQKSRLAALNRRVAKLVTTF